MTVEPEQSFATLFGREAEARGRAFGRVNLIGDHTDYNDGFVLPTAIPQETVVEVARGEDRHEVFSATLNRGATFGADGELPDFASYVGGCLRELADSGVAVPPLRLRVSSTVPVGAGLSSSAALEVATLRAVVALLGVDLPAVRMAQLAQRAEIEYAGVACGIMDQMACSLASTDRMLFLDTRSLAYRLLPLPPGAGVIVVDSGEPRALAASAYNTRRQECGTAAAMLGVGSLRDVEDIAAVEALPSPYRERARHVVSENQRVVAASTAPAEEFGFLMNASHASLREDYRVSTASLDALAAFLRGQPGVFGARMTGAGFGGACVALADSSRTADVVQAIREAKEGRAWRVIVPE